MSTVAYAQIDDKMGRHPAIRPLSDAAFRLHVCGILHCAEWLTDGRIEATDVRDLVRRFKAAALTELVDAGRWTPITVKGSSEPAAYLIEDYLDHNPTREVVLARKAKAAEKQRNWRERNGGGDQ